MKEESKDEEEYKTEEGGGDIFIDTSDITSSDATMEGGESPHSSDSGGQVATVYSKIKNHALICLQHLFKVSSKALFNYWHILFPSFIMKH